MKRVLGTLWIAVLAAGAATNSAGELSRQAVQLYQQVRYAEAETLFRQSIDAWKQQGQEGAQPGQRDDDSEDRTLVRSLGNQLAWRHVAHCFPSVGGSFECTDAAYVMSQPRSQ